AGNLGGVLFAELLPGRAGNERFLGLRASFATALDRRACQGIAGRRRDARFAVGGFFRLGSFVWPGILRWIVLVAGILGRIGLLVCGFRCVGFGCVGFRCIALRSMGLGC